jgi:hypothetical protein
MAAINLLEGSRTGREDKELEMFRSIALAAVAAASLGIAVIGTSTAAQADHWRGHYFDHSYGRGYGYGHRHGYGRGYYGGSPGWKYEHWRRHYGGAPYYRHWMYGPTRRHYGWAPGRVQVVPVIPR